MSACSSADSRSTHPVLQLDAICCAAVLLACLGVCWAPQVVGAAFWQLLPYAGLVACLAAAPLLIMLASMPW